MIATAGPSALWYLTRGTGLVTLVLLTASVVLGIVQVQRWAPEGSPRFVFVSLHRAVSLLVVALLAVHVLTAVLDSFAPIRLVDAVLPFAGTYRPLWLGLGALAFDLILALTITSLLRRRLGLPAWRAVHWLAYACWPVALVHGWGTGSDARTTWMLALTLGCAAAVLGAVGWRIASGRPDYARLRATAALAAVALSAVVGAWLLAGAARAWLGEALRDTRCAARATGVRPRPDGGRERCPGGRARPAAAVLVRAAWPAPRRPQLGRHGRRRPRPEAHRRRARQAAPADRGRPGGGRRRPHAPQRRHARVRRAAPASSRGGSSRCRARRWRRSWAARTAAPSACAWTSSWGTPRPPAR